MRVSEITVGMVAAYLRLDLEDLPKEEVSLLKSMMNCALAYICSYTGLTEAEADNYSDFCIVMYILCEDMYDNRSLYIDKGNVNKTVETILSMYRRNLV